MVAPDVDVVIAIHDPRRDIARSVGSALTSASVARVIVVCHNTPVDGIAAGLGTLADDSRVQLEAFDDGLRSPAGPFNRGLDLATARFTSIMGSDDELASGAVDAWAQAAARERADVVVPPLRHAGGGLVPTPPTRPRRIAGLDGIRDRLSYRTAPLGTGLAGALRHPAPHAGSRHGGGPGRTRRACGSPAPRSPGCDPGRTTSCTTTPRG